MNVFTDEDLVLIERKINRFSTEMMMFPFPGLRAIISRLKYAELKECNQLHCDHKTCNEWKTAKGEEI